MMKGLICFAIPTLTLPTRGDMFVKCLSRVLGIVWDFVIGNVATLFWKTLILVDDWVIPSLSF